MLDNQPIASGYMSFAASDHEEGNKDIFPSSSHRAFNVKHVCTYMNLMKYHNKLGIIILVSA